MAAASRAPRDESPVTARAVCLGLLAALVINLIMNYNDYYLLNSLLIGNHFPVISITAMFVLVVGGNAVARKFFNAKGLSSGELLLIWGMIGVAGGICAAGMMRYFPSWMVNPAYYASSGNDFAKFILPYLPDWMVVSRSPDDKAVRWFMEGLPHGESIPWGRWVTPMAAWGAFALCLYASNFAMVSILFQQWSARERLIFPVVQLPLALAAEPPPGRALNEFLSSRLTWIGAAIPCLLWGINGLRAYLPTLPIIPLSYNFWSIFPDRPWNEFRLDQGNVYFSVIGMTYLLTTEMGFSLWFTFVLVRLSHVFIAWLGSGATGYWGNWGGRIARFDTLGAMMAITVFLLWTARRHLREWWARALTGRSDPALDPFPPRVAAALMVVGVLGMMGWMLMAAAQWWVAIGSVLMFLMVLLILTRVVAESGLFFVQSDVISGEVFQGLFTPHVDAGVAAPLPAPLRLSGPSLAALSMQKAIFQHDLREILMPYIMNGVKACAQVRMHAGKVLAVFALTAAVGLAVAAYGRIATSYKYGGVNLDWYANIGEPDWILNGMANYQKNPPTYDWVKVGETRVLPVNVAHVAVGGAFAAAMLVLRARFLWWPLHPFGLVMAGTWAISMFWFSIMLGNVAKWCVMNFGGASVFRRLLPLFLGMIMGECVISVFWMLLGLATGTPGRPILPN